MAKGDESIYRGMVNDSNRKVRDVSVWRNESKSGLSYLSGIISKVHGSKLRIVLFERKEESGKSAPSHL